jgi:hypothetical protein
MMASPFNPSAALLISLNWKFSQLFFYIFRK